MILLFYVDGGGWSRRVGLQRYGGNNLLHRGLMPMASCALTVAAFARFPGVCRRDLVVTKRGHVVYAYSLPLLMLGQDRGDVHPAEEAVTVDAVGRAVLEWSA